MSVVALIEGMEGGGGGRGEGGRGEEIGGEEEEGKSLHK